MYLYYKSDAKRTEVVDGSNESLYHADEEMHPLLQNFSPSQTIPKNLDVLIKVNLCKDNQQPERSETLGGASNAFISPAL